MIKRILLALALAFASIGPTASVTAAPVASHSPAGAITALAAPVASHSPAGAIAALAAPVANINLTSSITSLTRTSPSGTVPMTWRIGLGANVHEGDYLHLIVYSDGTLSTIVQDVRHRLSHADLQSGATLALAADGLTAPTATQYLKATIETTSPLGLGYSYTFATAISPTDAITPMTWSTSDHNLGIGLSNGNLSATQGGGLASVRGSRAVGYDLTYWELKAVTFNSTYAGAVADSTASLSAYWKAAAFGGTQTTHAAEYAANDGAIYYDAGSAAAASVALNDVMQVALDRVNKKVWFGKNNTWQNGTPGVSGGTSMTGISTPIFPAAQLSDGVQLDANFGTTPGGTAGFTYAPPAGGFVAP